MHLAVEAVGTKHSGGAVVLMDVITAALESPLVRRVTVFCSPRSARRFEFPSSPRITVIERRGEEGAAGRTYWLLKGVGKEAEARRADVLLCMNGAGVSSLPTAVFVQQSLPFCREAMRRADWKMRYRTRIVMALMNYSCRRADLVIAQTPTMSRWIQERFEIAPLRVAVTLPWADRVGMDSEQTGSADAMLETPPENRLLYVGNTSGYKNIECLTRAMPGIRRAFPRATLFLTCPPDHAHTIGEGVVGLGYLGGQALRTAYGLATCCVTASLVESGNLTLIEAMSRGTPVVAADRPYARDLCGDAAAYFDPSSPEAFLAAIADVLRDQEKRLKMAQRGLAVAAVGREAMPYAQLIERLSTLAI